MFIPPALGRVALAALALGIAGRMPAAEVGPALLGGLDRLPLSFIENRGQLDDRVGYYVHGGEATVYFTSTGVRYALRGTRAEPAVVNVAFAPEAKAPRASRWTVAVEFEGARQGLKPEGGSLNEARVSYFRGREDEWKTGLRTYSSLVYREVWPGIDLTYTGAGGRLKYTFTVRPGADPRRIRLRYVGASDVSLDADGSLDVRTPMGGFRDEKPLAYQGNGAERVEVSAAYIVERAGKAVRCRFRLGAFDRDRDLVVDPVVLLYSGFIGGSGLESLSDVAVDPDGNVYVTGYTTGANFPVVVGPDLSFSGDMDGYVAKVKADGTGLVYSGFIGGSLIEQPNAVAVDAAGCAYVAGWTNSSQASFPVKVGPDLSYNGNGDVFVAKVAADGTSLVYAGYIGGSSTESPPDVAVDGAGNAYVSGYTKSTQPSFPVRVGPDLTHNDGGSKEDGFIAKVKANGTELEFAGYIGGDGDDNIYAMEIDAAGSAYVAGHTNSTEATFPVKTGPGLTHTGGGDGFDGFVAKVFPDGSGLEYCGYIGGDGHDGCIGIAVDATGSAYVTGLTTSTETTFPVKVGPDLTFCNDPTGDGFIAKVDPTGKELVFSGAICGDQYDITPGVAVDGSGHAYVSGHTKSTEASFPVKAGPDLTHNGGDWDGFVAKLRADGSGFIYAGYVGGAGLDWAPSLQVDDAGDVWLVGTTESDEQTFPTLVGPDLTANGGRDGFVAKLSLGGGRDCLQSASAVKNLRAAKAGDAVSLAWTGDDSANAYNVWYVAAKEDIEDATQSGSPFPATGVSECSVPSPAPDTACVDFGAVPRDAPARFFYQVRSYCDLSFEGP